MNTNRILLGWACVALAFVVIVLLGTGLVDPPGLANVRSSSDLLALFLSVLVVPLVLFVLGLWLIKGPRRR